MTYRDSGDGSATKLCHIKNKSLRRIKVSVRQVAYEGFEKIHDSIKIWYVAGKGETFIGGTVSMQTKWTYTITDAIYVE